MSRYPAIVKALDHYGINREQIRACIAKAQGKPGLRIFGGNKTDG